MEQSVGEAMRQQDGLHIILLDNDTCALRFIAQLLYGIGIRRDNLLATDKPAWVLQYCRIDAKTPDILITDMALNALSGTRIAYEVRKNRPSLGVIGITAYDRNTYLRSCIDAGMQALLDKSSLDGTIAPALQAVSQGEPYPENSGFPSVRQIQANMTQETAETSQWRPLTKTEYAIMSMSLGGLDARDVAKRCGLRDSTVYVHRRNICRKLGVGKWNEAMERCRELHLF